MSSIDPHGVLLLVMMLGGLSALFLIGAIIHSFIMMCVEYRHNRKYSHQRRLVRLARF